MRIQIASRRKKKTCKTKDVYVVNINKRQSIMNHIPVYKQELRVF